VAHLSAEKLRQKRPSMQMVFQDPQACLNPRMTLARIIGEPLDERAAGRTHQLDPRQEDRADL